MKILFVLWFLHLMQQGQNLKKKKIYSFCVDLCENLEIVNVKTGEIILYVQRAKQKKKKNMHKIFYSMVKHDTNKCKEKVQCTPTCRY